MVSFVPAWRGGGALESGLIHRDQLTLLRRHGATDVMSSQSFNKLIKVFLRDAVELGKKLVEQRPHHMFGHIIVMSLARKMRRTVSFAR